MSGGSHHSTALSGAALRALNEAILELNDPAKSGEELFDCLVRRCETLIPHSNFIVAGTDRQMRQPTTYFGPWAELAAEVTPAFHRHLADHPRFLQHCLSPVLLVDAVSGHVSKEKWRSTGLFDEVFKTTGSEDEIVASQPFNDRFTVSFVVNRDGWGFQQEEGALLALLLPHVVQAWRTRATIQRLEAAAGTGERLSERAGFQVVTDSSGYVIEASDEGELRRFWERFRESLRDSASQLPGPVRRWLRATLERHFRGDESSLRGRLSGDLEAPGGERFHLRLLPGSPHGLHVIAIERRDSPEKVGSWKLEALGLSPRRAQVLYWVAEGKSNEEVAAILGISIHTVKNHMKAIYGLLMVENRHAAALAAWRVLRADDKSFT